jgi:hypothetical protein
MNKRSLKPSFQSENKPTSKNSFSQNSFKSLRKKLPKMTQINPDVQHLVMSQNGNNFIIYNVSKINNQYNILSDNETQFQNLKKSILSSKFSKDSLYNAKIRNPFSYQGSMIKTDFDIEGAKSYMDRCSRHHKSNISGKEFEGRDESFYFYNLDLVQSNWLEYDGEIQNKKKHGKGIWTLGNGEVFEGNFVHGKANGQGKYVSMNNEILEGLWIDNKFQYKMGHEIYNMMNDSEVSN